MRLKGSCQGRRGRDGAVRCAVDRCSSFSSSRAKNVLEGPVVCTDQADVQSGLLFLIRAGSTEVTGKPSLRRGADGVRTIKAQQSFRRKGRESKRVIRRCLRNVAENLGSFGSSMWKSQRPCQLRRRLFGSNCHHAEGHLTFDCVDVNGRCTSSFYCYSAILTYHSQADGVIDNCAESPLLYLWRSVDGAPS